MRAPERAMTKEVANIVSKIHMVLFQLLQLDSSLFSDC
jgi:hypothetical protein